MHKFNLSEHTCFSITRAHQRVCSRKPMGSRNQPRNRRESHLGCKFGHNQLNAERQQTAETHCVVLAAKKCTLDMCLC